MKPCFLWGFRTSAEAGGGDGGGKGDHRISFITQCFVYVFDASARSNTPENTPKKSSLRSCRLHPMKPLNAAQRIGNQLVEITDLLSKRSRPRRTSWGRRKSVPPPSNSTPERAAPYHPTAPFASVQNAIKPGFGVGQTPRTLNTVGFAVFRETTPAPPSSISKRFAFTGSAESGGSLSETPNTKPETFSDPPAPQPASVTNDTSAERAISTSF